MSALEVASEADWPTAWLWLSPKLASRSVLTLTGNLGAGKTSFAKAIIKAMGCDLAVTSPTFSLVQTYTTKQGQVAHLDLYRLNTIEEVLDIGFYEYIEQSCLTIIEWPEIAAPLLVEKDTLQLKIEHTPQGGRRVLVL